MDVIYITDSNPITLNNKHCIIYKYINKFPSNVLKYEFESVMLYQSNTTNQSQNIIRLNTNILHLYGLSNDVFVYNNCVSLHVYESNINNLYISSDSLKVIYIHSDCQIKQIHNIGINMAKVYNKIDTKYNAIKIETCSMFDYNSIPINLESLKLNTLFAIHRGEVFPNIKSIECSTLKEQNAEKMFPNLERLVIKDGYFPKSLFNNLKKLRCCIDLYKPIRTDMLSQLTHLNVVICIDVNSESKSLEEHYMNSQKLIYNISCELSNIEFIEISFDTMLNAYRNSYLANDISSRIPMRLYPNMKYCFPYKIGSIEEQNEYVDEYEKTTDQYKIQCRKKSAKF